LSEIGYLIGYIGLAFGILVPIPQLIKIKRTHSLNGISLHTYIFLVIALACYLAHAIYIKSIVFTIAQSINLTTNGIVLGLLIRKHNDGDANSSNKMERL